MRTGFRRFSDGFRVVVNIRGEVKLPGYAVIREEHPEFCYDAYWQGMVLVPREEGMGFWKWCLGQDDVMVVLDIMDEFHCPSCLLRTKQAHWSPARGLGDSRYEVIAKCGHCEAFYKVQYELTKKRFGKQRRYK